MKVTKTLQEVHRELKELSKQRDLYALLVADAGANGNWENAGLYAKKYKSVDDVYKYMRDVVVTYEDPFVDEEDDEEE